MDIDVLRKGSEVQNFVLALCDKFPQEFVCHVDSGVIYVKWLVFLDLFLEKDVQGVVVAITP